MAVRYIQVQSISDLFSPAVRAYGNIAIIGAATVETTLPSKLFTIPPDIPDGKSSGDLEKAIAVAFQQTPGPTVVYGIPVTASSPDWKKAFETASILDVQLVVLANTPANEKNLTSGGPLDQFVNHLINISKEDGRERIGVVMLPKGSTDSTFVKGPMANDRMVYIAHKSDDDAAAAVAGTIAGYEPLSHSCSSL